MKKFTAMVHQKKQRTHPVYRQFKILLKELDEVIEKHVQIMVNQIEPDNHNSRKDQ